MSKRAVVLNHEVGGGAALVGDALEEAGFELDSRLRDVRPEDARAPLLVVMGGSMGAYEAESFPFLMAELEVLRERLASGRPTLGICLGSQLLARAGGARVYRGAAGVEIGAPFLKPTPEAKDDPIFSALPQEPVRMPQWHGDTFDPVPGAVRLAESEMYREQAFRVGQAYGIQFHPEADSVWFRGWLVKWAEDAAKVEKPRDQIEAELEALDASAEVQREFRRTLADVLFRMA
jgi:GMP synthase (glutamine-hydrolysing)